MATSEEFAAVKRFFQEWADAVQTTRSVGLLVAVDVGATNARVKFTVDCYESLSSELKREFDFPKYQANTVEKLLSPLKTLEKVALEVFGSNFASAGAALALAGPIEKAEKVELTNFKNTPALHKSDLPSKLFPFERTYFLNDLEGACYGVISLAEQRRLNEYFDILFDTYVTRIFVASKAYDFHLDNHRRRTTRTSYMK